MYPALFCEFLGTFWLVLGGCGAAVLGRGLSRPRHRLYRCRAGVRLDGADGRYAFGPISGGHFNPAVTIGLWAGGRFPSQRVRRTSQRRWSAPSSRPACCTSSPAAGLDSISPQDLPRTATARTRLAATRSAPRWLPKSS